MTRDELKNIDDRGLAAWNRHDPDAFLTLLADDFVWYDWGMPEPIRDKEGARAFFDAWMTAFPDMHINAVSQIFGEDGVAGELEFDGTNSGPMNMGGQTIPPTQKRISHAHGDYFARVRDGKIVEFRTHPDAAGMLMQLGLMPASMH